MSDWTTDEALDVARHVVYEDDDNIPGWVATTLAAKVIALRQAETDVAAAWGQCRDNPHIPAELRRALDELTARRST